MAKKKNRRQKKKRARAPTVAGLAELRALTSERPAAAAKTLSRALADPSSFGATTEELHEVAADLAAVFRAAQRSSDALELLAPLGRGSRRLRLEEALAAACEADWDRVRELGELDGALLPVVSCLLTVEAGTGVGKAPRGSAPALRALYAVGRAVDKAQRDSAAIALKSLTSTSRAPGVPVSEFRAGLRLLRGGRAADLEVILLAAPTGSELRRLAQVAYLRSDVARRADDGLVTDLVNSLPHALAQSAQPLTARKRAELVQRHIGADGFAEPAAALLHHGFHALAEGRPRDARDRLSRALELEGDLGECLRGLWLVERMAVREMFAGPSTKGYFRAVRSYARYLVKRDRSRAERAAVLLDVLEACATLRGGKAAGLAWLKELHEVVDGSWLESAEMLTDIDRAEARLYACYGEADRARGAIERALERKPQDPRLLTVALEIAEDVDDAAWRMELQELMGDVGAGLASAALGLDDEGPRCTPGRLVGQLVGAWAQGRREEVTTLVPMVEELTPTDRCVFDVATLSLLEADAFSLTQEAYFEERLEGSPRPEDARDLLIVGLRFGLEDMMKPIFLRLLDLGGYEPALADVVLASFDLSIPGFAHVLYGKLGAKLSRSSLKRLAGRMGRGHGIGLCDDVLDRAHDRVHPEHCLHDLEEMVAEMDGEADDDVMPDISHEMGSMVEILTEMARAEIGPGGSGSSAAGDAALEELVDDLKRTGVPAGLIDSLTEIITDAEAGRPAPSSAGPSKPKKKPKKRPKKKPKKKPKRGKR